jgi:hypothetical protein
MHADAMMVRQAAERRQRVEIVGASEFIGLRQGQRGGPPQIANRFLQADAIDPSILSRQRQEGDCRIGVNRRAFLRSEGMGALMAYHRAAFGQERADGHRVDRRAGRQGPSHARSPKGGH